MRVESIVVARIKRWINGQAKQADTCAWQHCLVESIFSIKMVLAESQYQGGEGSNIKRNIWTSPNHFLEIVECFLGEFGLRK
jgi:hypothetical protein